MEKNKYTLITIIVLLVVLLPLTIYGTYTSIRINTNFNRSFKYNDKLWFYDGKKLLGTYACKTERCDYATFENKEQAKIINNSYTFILDEGTIHLYNIKSGTVIATYDAVDMGEYSNYYVMKQENGQEKWGAIEITSDIVNKIKIEYDGVKYLNGKYVVKENNQYSLLDGEEKKFTSYNEITDYNDNYVVVRRQSTTPEYEVYDTDNKLYFMNNNPYDDIKLIDEYFLLKKYNNYYLYKIESEEEKMLGNFYYNGEAEITYEKTENQIEFFAGAESQKVVELNTEE